MARDFLCGDLTGFRCDVAALRRYYEEIVAPSPSQPYFDNGAEYVGWAITSRDGTVNDGVQQIKMRPEDRPAGSLPPKTATKPTPLCVGAGKQVLDNLATLGLKPFRVRIMALKDCDFTMTFHHDANREAWRLHVPIITNPGCFFDWKFGDQVIRRHFPADGRAWLVRVDQDHRAVNEQVGGGTRVHLLMSLMEIPGPHRLGAEAVKLPAQAA